LQWARIVLVVERGVSPAQRLKKLMDYSQPMSDGRRALVLRLNQSVSSKKFITIIAISISILTCMKYCMVKQIPVTVSQTFPFLWLAFYDLFWFPLRPVPVNMSLQILLLYSCSMVIIMVQKGVFHVPSHEEHF
jgi:hypothetical protein